jgi:hypothetical protein
MSHTAPKLITGVKYQSHCRTPRQVTGWLTHKSDPNGLSADSLLPVTLLTAEGEKIPNVLVRVIDVLGLSVRDFSRSTEQMLWRVAELDFHGYGELAFAELAYRERQELEAKEREVAARLADSRRNADLLMGRV